MNKKTRGVSVDFQSYLASQLKNPVIKKHYDDFGKQLEIAYQIVQLRNSRKMSQAKLAETLGTTQSNVARMESGQQNFTTTTLQKIATVFNRSLTVKFASQSK